MSFEGYYQRLCKNGHDVSVDCYSIGDPNEGNCPVCGAEIVWTNIVDVTNGSYNDDNKRIDGCIDLEVESQEVCEHCGSILNIKYKIPKKE